ncbi:MAG: putative secreted protein [Candidatus Phytoplasma cynodontis]|uniref:YitT family protein n=1 Tax='Cynodon dactylon' phytoplasma TaxID=295320 RepID=UPI001265C179|nr:YitT family protein ['Cynodon dactylon' phytoplasma]KAB8122076.1 YitT family protein ['Cynodon dactylon' phytoplasma]WIA07507.1 MAG: putative secreted protein [Candidatus Phytoplasma cynodontis]
MIKKNLKKIKEKIDFKVIILGIFLSFIYVLSDALFVSGQYKIKIYTTGIHGIGDAIAKILKDINNKNYLSKFPLLSNYTRYNEFNGFFAGIFYGIVNILLFLFIAFPKLDYKFNINSFINSFVLFIFVIILAKQINGDNGYLYKMKNCFGLFKPEGGFLISFIRIILTSIIAGIAHGFAIKIGSSTGGTDIIAKYLSNYKKKDISFYITISNFLICLIAVIIIFIFKREFEWESLILSIIKILMTGYLIYFINKKKNLKKS